MHCAPTLDASVIMQTAHIYSMRYVAGRDLTVTILDWFHTSLRCLDTVALLVQTWKVVDATREPDTAGGCFQAIVVGVGDQETTLYLSWGCNDGALIRNRFTHATSSIVVLVLFKGGVRRLNVCCKGIR